MASGFSWGGGRSRCFTQWQEFRKCYAGSCDPNECRLPLDDYLECLHRRKEIERAQAVQEVYRKMEQEAKEIHKAAVVSSAEAPAAAVGPIRDEPK